MSGERGFEVEQPAVKAVGFCNLAKGRGVEKFTLGAAVKDMRSVRGIPLDKECAQTFYAITVTEVNPWRGGDGDKAVREVDEGGGEVEVFGGVRKGRGGGEYALRGLDGEVGALEIMGEEEVRDFGCGESVRARTERGVRYVSGVREGGFWVPGGQGLGVLGDERDRMGGLTERESK